jgi:hypothetical protein
VIIRAGAVAARVSTPPITIVSGGTLAGELSMRSMCPTLFSMADKAAHRLSFIIASALGERRVNSLRAAGICDR